MKLAVIDINKSDKAGVASALSSLDTLHYRADIVARVVDWQLAKRRATAAGVKNRGDVACTTRRIYRQKGTGNARHGPRSVNLFRGGGRTFGPQVRDFGYPLNKKIRLAGLRYAFAKRLQDKQLFVLGTEDLKAPKTASLKSAMKKLGLEKTLIIAPKSALPNLRLAARNIPGCDFLPADAANVYDIVRHKEVLVWQDSLKELEARLDNLTKPKAKAEDKPKAVAKADKPKTKAAKPKAAAKEASTKPTKKADKK